jgi:drug/metabolite transporter (DMT)-like permease
MEDVKSQWFLPMLFLAAFLVQAGKTLHTHRRLPKKYEMIYGFLGGVANGAATFFLMQATEYASEFQRAMLFPIFAVGIIILCNVWGHYLYKEEVNWWANLLCVAGIIIATVDWTIFI